MQRLITSRSRFYRPFPAIWGLLFLFAAQPAWAVGTPAGTVISNTVTVNYQIGGTNQAPVTSAPVSLTVDELIQPTLTWQDAAPVSVNSPDINHVLTFRLTNSGNGQEAFSLSRINGPLPNYTPLTGSVGSIYLENGLQAGFQASGPNADTAYISGANDPTLAADATQILYVVSDTPANVAANAQGEVQLTASSMTAGAAGALPGASFAGLGQGGGFAVVGSSRGQASTIGRYIVSGAGLGINKTIIGTVDQSGTTVLMPGTVLTYQIAVTLSGTGTATNLVITDPMPANLGYVANSIAVNGIAQTDAADADKAQFSANTVSVSLGDVAAPANFVITFRATIN